MARARMRPARSKLSLKFKRKFIIFLCALIIFIIILVLYAVQPRSTRVSSSETETFQRNVLLASYEMEPLKADRLSHSLSGSPHFGYWGNKTDLLNCVYYGNKIWFAAVDAYPNLLPAEFRFMDASSVFFSENEANVADGFLKDLLELLRGDPTAARVRQPVVAAPADRDSGSRPNLVVYIGSAALRSFFEALEQYGDGSIIKALDDADRRLTVVTGGSDDYLSGTDLVANSPRVADKLAPSLLHSYLEKPWLHSIYAQNCDVGHEKVVCVPAGVDLHSRVGKNYNTQGYTQQTEGLLSQQLAIMRKDKRFVLYGSSQDGRLASGAMFSLRFQQRTEMREMLRKAKQLYVWDAADRHAANAEEGEDDAAGEEKAKGMPGRSGQTSALSFLKAYQPKEVVLLVPQLDARYARLARSQRDDVGNIANEMRTKPLYVTTGASGTSTVYVPLYTFFQHFAEFTFGQPARENKILSAFNLNVFRQRFSARRQIMQSRLGFLFEGKSMKSYYDALSRFAFMASPVGTAYDCHRTWEALLMGCIPIVQHPRVLRRVQPESVNTTLGLFEDLPVFVVEDYSTITAEQLKMWKEEVQRKTMRGEYKFEKLFSQYWVERAFAV